MVRWRERYPYEWICALGAAVLVAISPWGPSTPFSGLLLTWFRWVAQPLLGGIVFSSSMHDGFVSLFLPIAAAALSYPLLVFCSRTLGAPRRLTWLMRITAALMFVLAGLAVADGVVDVGRTLAFGQIAAGCAVGVLLVVFGVRLFAERSLSRRIRTVGALLALAGACIATFVFLPLGLLVLCAAYIAMTVVLARRETAQLPSR